VWFPGKTAQETAKLARKISWHATDGVAELRFPGAGQQMFRITADLRELTD
jgi:hypothetical protein